MRRLLFLAAVLAATVAASVPQSASSSGPMDIYRVRIWMQGNGLVTSTPHGITCPSRCIATFVPHARVKFIAKAKKGWTFLKWYHGCKGKSPVCYRTLADGDNIVAAAFRKG